MRYLLLLLILTTGFGECAHAQQPPAAPAPTKKLSKKAAARAATLRARQAQLEAGPVLTFARTPCYGLCPTYSMQVFADGRVAYEGQRGVPLLGKKEFRLPAAKLAALLRAAEEAHFDQFDARYARGTTDLPSIVITIRRPNGYPKTVMLEEGAPENVVRLFTYFRQQFDTLAQLDATADK